MNFFEWHNLPWHIFNDPFRQWENLPTFLGIEYMSYFLVMISFVHAFKNDKNHLLVWTASFITGSANDIFFMALPMVDNFWQAQATIMISPRLPLYICCIYNIFLYYSTISSWRLNFENLWPEAAVTGFLALFIYYPYDLIGAKHLWWTWHTTDPPIMNRILGVPIGSSLWILTFSGCFSLILYLCRGKFKFSFIKTVIFSAVFTTPLMMLVMTVLQFISLEKQGVPSLSGFSVCLFIYATIIIIYSTLLIDTSHSFKWIEHRSVTKLNILLGSSIVFYFIFLVLAGNFGKPEFYKSIGIHQSIGPCNVTVTDFTGLMRNKYVCHENVPNEWNFACLPKDQSPLEAKKIIDWYTICGSPHEHEKLWKQYLTVLCLLGGFTYFFILILLMVFTKRRNFKRKNQ